MRIKYHEGIYYPSEKEKLDSLIGSVTPDKEAKAIIVPHQALNLSYKLLRSVFSYMKGKDRAIVIVPSHNKRMAEDKSFFFEGDLLEGSNMISLGAEKNEAYCEEEPSGELLLPFFERVVPSMKYAIVYTDITNAKESKIFASFLEKNNTPSTLFIISTNLSPKCSTQEEMEEWRIRAIDLLNSDGTILDSLNHKKAIMCGGTIVDAVNRIIPGPWKLIENGSDTTTAHSVLIKEERF